MGFLRHVGVLISKVFKKSASYLIAAFPRIVQNKGNNVIEEALSGAVVYLLNHILQTYFDTKSEARHNARHSSFRRGPDVDLP